MKVYILHPLSYVLLHSYCGKTHNNITESGKFKHLKCAFAFILTDEMKVSLCSRLAGRELLGPACTEKPQFGSSATRWWLLALSYCRFLEKAIGELGSIAELCSAKKETPLAKQSLPQIFWYCANKLPSFFTGTKTFKTFSLGSSFEFIFQEKCK